LKTFHRGLKAGIERTGNGAERIPQQVSRENALQAFNIVTGRTKTDCSWHGSPIRRIGFSIQLPFRVMVPGLASRGIASKIWLYGLNLAELF